MDAVATLASALDDLGSGYLLVVTGAGVSKASGIDTFRGSEPGAVWRQNDMKLATRGYFESDPVGQWVWYRRRFAAVDDARPNPAHLALAALERFHEARGGRFLLVTQNIDTLHEQAGSRRLIKVHGSSDRMRCSRYGCRHGAPEGSLPRADFDLRALAEEPSMTDLPRCPECGSLMRAHVLFFDEYYTEHRDYQFARVEKAASAADLVLFVGTSFSVGVTDLFLHAAYRRRVPTLSIDPASGPAAVPWLTVLAVPAEDALPAVCRRLGVVAEAGA